MMKSNTTWKSLRQDFAVREILDALFGGFVFATILYVPLAIALIEVITVYMYLLTLFVIIIIISLFAYVFAIYYFWQKSLKLKKTDIATNIQTLFLHNMMIIDAVILVLGLIFLFVMIPVLWV